MPVLTADAKINGTDYGQVGSYTTTNSPNAFAQAVSFGAFAAGASHFDIRNIKVGTTAYGSSDLFAPALSGLGDFDGVYGNDGSIVVSGGVLSVDDDSNNDHYAWKDLPNVAVTYVEFQLRVRPGDTNSDYHDVWADDTFPPTNSEADSGIFNGNSGVLAPDSEWDLDQPGSSAFGQGPTGAPSWDTIDLRWSYAGAPPVFAKLRFSV